ncbi:hypothetical protein [Corynebacterium pelargi]|uniref:hypothetical protein n=1 Tax=Corynebacterium pelargi TaxID=1471400 RepID=UPI0010090D24|nr:hypothetical protein [Corynebacterium pelargi]GGG78042.1 hypothetical protein GCM10007338_14970 [Corynebacterium pelargi]
MTDPRDDRTAYVHQGFSKGEAAFGLFWLSLGALISVFLEVIYLGTWIGGVPVPYTVVIALLFNLVLSKTALLWAPASPLKFLPLGVWILGFFLFVFATAGAGDTVLVPGIRSILLLLAGIAGGVWPMLRAK